MYMYAINDSKLYTNRLHVEILALNIRQSANINTFLRRVFWSEYGITIIHDFYVVTQFSSHGS